MTEFAIPASERTGPKTGEVCPLADDLLRGADKIAEFLFGDPGQRRKVYHLRECSRLPVFKLGAVLPRLAPNVPDRPVSRVFCSHGSLSHRHTSTVTMSQKSSLTQLH